MGRPLSPLEKLERALEPTPEEVALMSIEEVEAELRAAGISEEATNELVQSVKKIVQEKMTEWELELKEAPEHHRD